MLRFGFLNGTHYSAQTSLRLVRVPLCVFTPRWGRDVVTTPGYDEGLAVERSGSNPKTRLSGGLEPREAESQWVSF